MTRQRPLKEPIPFQRRKTRFTPARFLKGALVTLLLPSFLAGRVGHASPSTPPCLLELEREGELYTTHEIFSGNLFEGKSSEERERIFHSLPAEQQELILLSLAQFTQPLQRLGDLLTEVADMSGQDLHLYQIRIPSLPQALVYRVSMGLGDNEYGFMLEKVAEIALADGKVKPLFKFVTTIRDGFTENCDSAYWVRTGR